MNTFTIIKTTHLDHQQLQDLLQLEKLCQEHDHISLSVPTDPDEETIHFLLYNNEKILFSALSLLFYDEHTAECIAFTQPDQRNQGYFSKLLDAALDENEEYDILFPVSGACPDTLAALEHLGAELDSQELQMELDFKEVNEPSTNDPCFLSCQTDDPSLTNWHLSSPQPENLVLGSCQTSRISCTSVCLHHVEILPEFRGRGYGTLLIEKLVQELKSLGISRMILQVAGDNQAAIALYKKQGFRITETLSFYLY